VRIWAFRLLSVPMLVVGMFTLLTTAAYAQAGEATIQAQFNCTSATNVCFTLTVSTRDFPNTGRDVSLTLFGHRIGDPANHYVRVSASRTLHLDQNLDNATLPPTCFAGVDTASFDSFKLDIKPFGTAFTVNGKTDVALGPFTNSCPVPAFVIGIITGPHTFTLEPGKVVVVGEKLHPNAPFYFANVPVTAVTTNSKGVTTVTTGFTFLPLNRINKMTSFTVVSVP
jgi:hypothetical protein